MSDICELLEFPSHNHNYINYIMLTRKVFRSQKLLMTLTPAWRECVTSLFKCSWNNKTSEFEKLLPGGVLKPLFPPPLLLFSSSFKTPLLHAPTSSSSSPPLPSPYLHFISLLLSSSPPGCCSAVGFRGCCVLKCSPNHVLLLLTSTRSISPLSFLFIFYFSLS